MKHTSFILGAIALCSFLSLTSLAVHAQDLDYPDFRNKKDNFSRIYPKELKPDISTFAMAGIEESINRPPLPKLPLKDVSANYVTYEGDGIQVYIKTAPFVPTKHKLMSIEDHLVKIDGKPFYGCYGVTPKTAIDTIGVIIGKDTVSIPSAAYKDIFNPSFSFSKDGSQKTRNNVFVSKDKRYVYIYMMGMGDGGTEYTWIIQDKVYLRRVLDYGVLR